jgi:integrative and conjugative element protein (TIGR02256 family)
MIFKGETEGLLKLSEKVVSVFHQYRQLRRKDKEAGGVLLGRFIQNSEDVVVDRVTEPMERDVRKRYFFQKCREDHQRIIHAVWEESNGTCNYLGEWHTHPEPHPTPSPHDLREWKKVLKDTVCDSDKLFFVIVGTKSVEVWVGLRPSLEIKKLTRCW